MNVILLHGFLNSGRCMRGLAAYLTKAGHRCFTPSLRPSDGRAGLPDLAAKLAAYIDDVLPAGARFALVGFSMGAIVSRYYLQEMGGCERVDAFFSISGPHAGTRTAYVFPGLGVRQMRLRSPFLASLDASIDRLAGMPVACYWTPYDLMITPHTSAKWSRGELVRIPAPLHALMIFDKRLHADIERRLAVLSKAAAEEASIASA